MGYTARSVWTRSVASATWTFVFRTVGIRDAVIYFDWNADTNTHTDANEIPARVVTDVDVNLVDCIDASRIFCVLPSPSPYEHSAIG